MGTLRGAPLYADAYINREHIGGDSLAQSGWPPCGACRVRIPQFRGAAPAMSSDLAPWAAVAAWASCGADAQPCRPWRRGVK